jgi:hypothetical protein
VDERGRTLTYVTEDGGETRLPLDGTRVWLRAACDFLTEEARFSYSTDGKTFHLIGAPFRLVFQLLTFQGVRYALFNFRRDGTGGGYADFDSIDVEELNPRGLTTPIPYGRRIELATHGSSPRVIVASNGGLRAGEGAGTPFRVVDRRQGRVALRGAGGFMSAAPDGQLSIRNGTPGDAQTFQWIETFTGELTLLSLATHRYVRLDREAGRLAADSPGPHPNERDGVRWAWHAMPAR